jgi:tetraprenyl-beta-curcumene synthase
VLLVNEGARRPRVHELAVLPLVAARFWLRVMPVVRAELDTWRQRAATIPDPQLRAHALSTLTSERLSAAGAALFATTLTRHRPVLVRTLVAYQVICDYLDTLSEQPSADPIANGMTLHRALADAVAPNRAPTDWYRLHSSNDDGGYLAALVAACRAGCEALPAFSIVGETARREASRNAVQGIKDGPADERSARLQQWARVHSEGTDASWFELAAAASSPLAVLALLAAAGDPATSKATVARTRRCYFPCVEGLSTLLDSHADRAHDEAAGELSLVAQYPSTAVATARLRTLTARAFATARALPNGERHAVLIAGMIAMHLSDPNAWLPAAKGLTRSVLRSSLAIVTPLLLTIMRLWRASGARRTAYADGGACVPTPTPTGQLTPVPPSPQ